MLHNFIVFGAAGLLGEIVFTALRSKHHSLKGHTNLWVFMLYGLGAFLFPILWSLLSAYSWPVRGVTYSIVIMSVEYVAGRSLHRYTGSCPWDYWGAHRWWTKQGDILLPAWHNLRYVQLSYCLIWLGVGFIGEVIYRGVIL